MRYSFSGDPSTKLWLFLLQSWIKDKFVTILYVQLWHIHNAEQMILDHEEENPEEYKDKKFEETIDPSFDEENSVEYTKAYYKDALLPKMILVMGLLTMKILYIW